MIKKKRRKVVSYFCEYYIDRDIKLDLNAGIFSVYFLVYPYTHLCIVFY